MNVTEERKELFKAISEAQGEFTTVEKNARNPHFNSKFAPLDSIIEMIRPILPKHGLSAMQFTDVQEHGVVIETIITHESGQYISGRLFMPAVKIDPQGYGSCITYGRRYALAAALGIVSDEDVDGNNNTEAKKADTPRAKATPPPEKKTPPQGQEGAKITAGQKKMIEAQLGTANIDRNFFKAEMGIEHIEDLSFAKMNEALEWIKTQREKN